MPWADLRVPASSANLGPGFDALGLALDLYLRCRFRPAGALAIRAWGCDAASIPTEDCNLIWQTALRIAQDSGLALPPVELEIHNEIPLGKGLGSSAAALTAGVVIANSLLQLGWSRERVLEESARLEGHPDNVAACVLGGITVSALDDAGCACALRFTLPPGCSLALLIPNFVLPTAHSRAVLPSSYSREDAIFNLQRMGLLVGSLANGNTELLKTALADRFHQPFRAPLVPGLADIIALRHPDLFGCVLSGAGPSVLVWFRSGCGAALDHVESVMRQADPKVLVLPVSVAPEGYCLELET